MRRIEKGDIPTLNRVPMISVPGVGGFRHADMLLVTADGNEVPTKLQRGLISI